MRSIADYLGGLVLAGGDHDGQLFTVLPWERRFVFGAFRQSGDAGLSVARGNGKSALVAGLAAAVVDPVGPLHGPRRDVVCVAAAFEQSRIIYEDVLSFLGSRYDLEDRKVWRKQDSANRAILEFRETGARVRCIGGDPKTAHGLRPALALLDEPAQWEPSTRDKMLAAIRTGLGKVPGSKLIALGTRPAIPEHWFARLLDGAPYAQVHAAPETAPPFWLRTWRRANPSLDHLPSLRAEIAEEARAARTDPDALAGFRALRLNQGTEDVTVSTLLDAGLWRRITTESPEPGGGACWGVDLGGTAAQSAIACYWPSTGLLEALAAFPSEPDLATRGLRDGVGRLYVECHKRGELLTSGGRAVNVADLVRAAVDRWGPPVAIAADRWREGELHDALAEAGLRRCHLDLRGQGFKDGGEDVRAFRRACLEGRVSPRPSLLLTAAMAAARTVGDAAGNHKLAKSSQGGRRQKARDDAAAAAILAVALGERAPKPRRGGLRTALAG